VSLGVFKKKSVIRLPGVILKDAGGFTLLETLIVMAIGILLGAFSFFAITHFNAVRDLDLAASSMVSFVRDAQQKAISQESSSDWGVHFENPSGARGFYALYSTLYSIGATSTAVLPATVEFFDPSVGNHEEAHFEKITGVPTTTASVTLRLVSDPSETRIITINTNGSISY
jgi:type II secretory pathway pseudopilin PulG